MKTDNKSNSSKKSKTKGAAVSTKKRSAAPKTVKLTEDNVLSETSVFPEKEPRHAFKIVIYPNGSISGFHGQIEHLNTGEKNVMHSVLDLNNVPAFLFKYLFPDYQLAAAYKNPRELLNKMSEPIQSIDKTKDLELNVPLISVETLISDKKGTFLEQEHSVAQKIAALETRLQMQQKQESNPIFMSKFDCSQANVIRLKLATDEVPFQLQYRLKLKDNQTNCLLWETDYGVVPRDIGQVFTVPIPANLSASIGLFATLEFFEEHHNTRTVLQKVVGLVG